MTVATLPVRRHLGRVGLSLALLCVPVLSRSQADPPDALVGAVEAGQWLARLRQAADATSYRGTLLFSAGGMVSSTRVAHFFEGKQRYELAEALDGQAKLRFRHNDELVTVWPAKKVAVLEARDGVAEFPGLPDAAGLSVLDNYQVLRAGEDRIAGHLVLRMLLKPRDNHRYAQRLWTDSDSGLLLRGDVLGAGGEVLESMAFTDLKMQPKPQPELVLKPMRQLSGLRVVQAQATKTQLEAEGWQLARPVAGFKLVSCSKRALDAASADASAQVLQTVFTDGLASVSLFIEAYDRNRHKQALRTMVGATHTLMHRRGDWWITVVGEVPLATVQQFDEALVRLPR